MWKKELSRVKERRPNLSPVASATFSLTSLLSARSIRQCRSPLLPSQRSDVTLETSRRRVDVQKARRLREGILFANGAAIHGFKPLRENKLRRDGWLNDPESSVFVFFFVTRTRTAPMNKEEKQDPHHPSLSWFRCAFHLTLASVSSLHLCIPCQLLSSHRFRVLRFAHSQKKCIIVHLCFPVSGSPSSRTKKSGENQLD